MQHPDGGVISELLVEEGDFVEANQLLVRLDPTDLQSELSIVEGQLFELMARRGRLEAEQDGKSDIEFEPELLQAAKENPDVHDLIEGQIRLVRARDASEAQEVDQLAGGINLGLLGALSGRKHAEGIHHIAVLSRETLRSL